MSRPQQRYTTRRKCAILSRGATLLEEVIPESRFRVWDETRQSIHSNICPFPPVKYRQSNISLVKIVEGRDSTTRAWRCSTVGTLTLSAGRGMGHGGERGLASPLFAIGGEDVDLVSEGTECQSKLCRLKLATKARRDPKTDFQLTIGDHKWSKPFASRTF